MPTVGLVARGRGPPGLSAVRPAVNTYRAGCEGVTCFGKDHFRPAQSRSTRRRRPCHACQVTARTAAKFRWPNSISAVHRSGRSAPIRAPSPRRQSTPSGSPLWATWAAPQSMHHPASYHRLFLPELSTTGPWLLETCNESASSSCYGRVNAYHCTSACR